jgi:hypothetical protein
MRRAPGTRARSRCAGAPVIAWHSRHAPRPTRDIRSCSRCTASARTPRASRRGSPLWPAALTRCSSPTAPSPSSSARRRARASVAPGTSTMATPRPSSARCAGVPPTWRICSRPSPATTHWMPGAWCSSATRKAATWAPWRRSAIARATAQGYPVLALHGERDRATPLEPQRRSLEELRAAGLSVELRTHPGGHGFRSELLPAIDAFARRVLGL